MKIFAPKEGFGVYGGDLPSAFYRKDTSLAPEQRYYDGVPPDVKDAAVGMGSRLSGRQR